MAPGGSGATGASAAPSAGAPEATGAASCFRAFKSFSRASISSSKEVCSPSNVASIDLIKSSAIFFSIVFISRTLSFFAAVITAVILCKIVLILAIIYVFINKPTSRFL